MKALKNSTLWSAFVFGFILPFNTWGSNIALIIFYILLFIQIISGNKQFESSNFNILKYSTILLVIPAFLSLMITDDFHSTINTFGKRISYLLTPILFLFVNKEDLGLLKKNSLKGLLYGVLLSSLFLIINNFYEYYLTKPLWSVDKDLLNYYHTNRNYTSIIDIHPTYYGMYVLLGSISLFTTPLFNSKVLKITGLTILTISVIFLNSRVISALFFSTHLYFIYSFIQSKFKNKGRVILLFAGFIIIVGFAFKGLFKGTYVYNRITKELSWDLSYEVGTNYNTAAKGDSRLARWQIAVDCIKEQPILGFGIGTESKELAYKYYVNQMSASEKNKYNAHNQYLGFAIEGGLLGLALLIYFFSFNLRFAIKNRNLVSIHFFLFLVVVSFFENYLIRNAGITYISFYATLFLFTNKMNSTS